MKQHEIEGADCNFFGICQFFSVGISSEDQTASEILRNFEGIAKPSGFSSRNFSRTPIRNLSEYSRILGADGFSFYMGSLYRYVHIFFYFLAFSKIKRACG